MKKIGSAFFLLLFYIFTVSSAWAEESLKVEIQPDSVGVGDQVYIYVTVQSSDDFSMEAPRIPEIQGLSLLQSQNNGQSSSTRMSFINGKTEFSKTVQQQFVFLYQATQKGIATIPAVTVSVNGKTMMSAPQKIAISEKSQAKPKQQPSGRPQYQDDPDPFGDENDPFEQLMRQRMRMLEEIQKQMGRGGGGAQIFNPGMGAQNPQQIPSRQLDVNTNEAFFLLLDADKKTVYEGEQITTKWYIYTRGNIESLDRAKFPDLKGFWKEIIEEVPSLQFQEEIVNGVLYRKALLASHALFPIKPGVSVIDEFKIKAKVRLPTQFGWGDLHEYTKASKRFPVTVLPLPSENKPKSFSGAVGQFQIQTQVDGSQFPAGQPFSVRVRFEGQGNAKLIELPEIEWPQGLEVYDTKSEAKFFKDGQSFKEFEILVVPRNQGDVKIPEIKFSYFDPVLKQYITKSTEEFNLKITEAVKGNVNSINAANNSNSLENKDTAQIFLPVADISSSWFSWTKYRLLFFVTLSFLVFIGFVIKFGLDMVNLNQIPELKHKVIAKLKTIEKHKKNNDYKLVGAEAVNLLYLIAAHLAQENTSTQDWSSLVYKMPEAYRSAYADKLSDLFEYFQTLGFAPDSLKELALSRNSLDSMASDLKVTANKIVAEIS